MSVEGRQQLKYLVPCLVSVIVLIFGFALFTGNQGGKGEGPSSGLKSIEINQYNLRSTQQSQVLVTSSGPLMDDLLDFISINTSSSWFRDGHVAILGKTSYSVPLDSIWNFSLSSLVNQFRFENTTSHFSVLQDGMKEINFNESLTFERLNQLLHQGFGIQLRWSNLPTDHILSPFRDMVQKTLGVRISINSYISPSSTGVFGLHSDGHDIFVLHLQGSKTWTLCLANDVMSGRTEEGSTQDRVCQDVVVGPGQILYVPAGLLHRVKTTSIEPAVHHSVGVHRYDTDRKPDVDDGYTFSHKGESKLRGDCDPCPQGCLGVCYTTVEKDSPQCSTHGTGTRDRWWWDTCGGCGVDRDWVCSCYEGWTGLLCADKVCKKGEYVSWDTCLECESGKFSSDDDHTHDSCQDCAPGYYQDQTGQTFCSECGSGSFSNSPQTCVTCPSGKYSQYSLSTSCVDCQRDEYCPEGSQNPSPCSNAPDCQPGEWGSCGRCSPCRECGSAEYQSSGCDEVEDRQCHLCSSLPCPDGQIRMNCGFGQEGSCHLVEVGVTCTPCGSDQFQSAVCSPESDGTCESCVSDILHCPTGTERIDCGNGNVGRCETVAMLPTSGEGHTSDPDVADSIASEVLISIISGSVISFLGFVGGIVYAKQKGCLKFPANTRNHQAKSVSMCPTNTSSQ